MAFSDKTRAWLIEYLISAFTHDRLTLLFMKVGIRDYDSGGSGKHSRVLNLLSNLRTAPDQAEGERLLCNLIKYVLESDDMPSPTTEQDRTIANLLSALKLDGWEIVDGRLLPASPAPASISEKITGFEELLVEMVGPEAQKHYRQAVDNLRSGPGNEEACNGQLRNVLDAVLPVACERLSGTRVDDANGAIQHLHQRQILGRGWFELLRGLYALSNTKGAHVGLSDADDALFRVHITTATLRYLLRLSRAGSSSRP